jgi:RHH-type rel operon transcriptional repressor/antitoxin RelB
MLALRLPDDLEKRLDALARRTGRSKSFYAREAIEAHLADIEDAYLALDRLERGARRVSLDEVEAEFASVDAAARQDQ